MDEEMSNSTMDMTTNSSLNNSNSHLHNHINSSIKDDGPNSNSSSNSHTLHTTHHLGAAANNNNSNNNHQAPWQKFGLTTPSNMMGIDLSNHSGSGALSLSSLHGSGLPLPLSLSAGSPQSVSGSQGSGCGQASKRRKKETPRRIDLPRTAGMPLPAFNSTMGSEMEEDDDAASEDSMAAHERNHVDGLKMDLQHDQTYGDDEECDGQENYEENDPGAQGEDDISSEHGDEMDDDQDGALSLRVSNLSDSERMDRERSRKGNPMKKMLGIGNNNNNNEGGPQNLIHNVSSGGD
ncbi:hypothetical protein Ocin01_18528 [Orchesella cincta]|uniref:Uncharacterized protein n=1 Tax=Orchesella cincta TaxID=48709 RepID=A0A1D2M5A5_ORCCI|nr:hypothetical protein Ocin01_18528 [Orchesella cincta]